jgi:hypothetical protein
MTNFRRLLEKAAMSPTLAETARLALTMTGGGESLEISHGEGAPQSSKEVAKTYTLRRSMDYYKKRKITGLDETIDLLNCVDRVVHLSYVQMETALICIWFEVPGQLICGLIVIERID